MAKQKKSAISYSRQQLEILQQISRQLTKVEKIPYNQITEKFNELCSQRIPNFSKKSKKAIQNKIAQILERQIYDWSVKQIQLILDLTAEGKKWSKIAQMPKFVEAGLNHNSIKKKFETELRSKFCILYRQIYHSSENKLPSLSDRTLKALLKDNELKKLNQQKVLDETELNCLLENVPYFKKVINTQRKIKSNQYRIKTLSLLNDRMSIQTLVKAIKKINTFFKGLKKLSGDWVEKEYEDYKGTKLIGSIYPNEASNTMMTLLDEEKSWSIESQQPFKLLYQSIDNDIYFERELNDPFRVQEEQNQLENEF